MYREYVLPWAERVLVPRLAPYCAKVVLTGSLRRPDADIDLVEVLCVLRESSSVLGGSEVDMAAFADGVKALVKGETLLPDEKAKKHPAYLPLLSRALVERSGCPGTDPHRTGAEAHLPVHLWRVTAKQAGLALALTTGSAAFAAALSAPLSQGGFLPDEWAVNARFLTLTDADGVALDTSSEKAIFALCGLPYLKVAERTADAAADWSRELQRRRRVGQPKSGQFILSKELPHAV